MVRSGWERIEELTIHEGGEGDDEARSYPPMTEDEREEKRIADVRSPPFPRMLVAYLSSRASLGYPRILFRPKELELTTFPPSFPSLSRTDPGSLEGARPR